MSVCESPDTVEHAWEPHKLEKYCQRCGEEFYGQPKPFICAKGGEHVWISMGAKTALEEFNGAPVAETTNLQTGTVITGAPDGCCTFCGSDMELEHYCNAVGLNVPPRVKPPGETSAQYVPGPAGRGLTMPVSLDVNAPRPTADEAVAAIVNVLDSVDPEILPAVQRKLNEQTEQERAARVSDLPSGQELIDRATIRPEARCMWCNSRPCVPGGRLCLECARNTEVLEGGAAIDEEKYRVARAISLLQDQVQQITERWPREFVSMEYGERVELRLVALEAWRSSLTIASASTSWVQRLEKQLGELTDKVESIERWERRIEAVEERTAELEKSDRSGMAISNDLNVLTHELGQRIEAMDREYDQQIDMLKERRDAIEKSVAATDQVARHWQLKHAELEKRVEAQGRVIAPLVTLRSRHSILAGQHNALSGRVDDLSSGKAMVPLALAVSSDIDRLEQRCAALERADGILQREYDEQYVLIRELQVGAVMKNAVPDPAGCTRAAEEATQAVPRETSDQCAACHHHSSWHTAPGSGCLVGTGVTASREGGICPCVHFRLASADTRNRIMDKIEDPDPRVKRDEFLRGMKAAGKDVVDRVSRRESALGGNADLARRGEDAAVGKVTAGMSPTEAHTREFMRGRESAQAEIEELRNDRRQDRVIVERLIALVLK